MLTRCTHCCTSSRQAHSLFTLLRNTKGLSKAILSKVLEYGIKEQIRREYFPNTGQQSQQVMILDSTVDVSLTTAYDVRQYCCQTMTSSMIRVCQQGGCRMSYRWHTLHIIIARYFVLVIIPKSSAYEKCGALLLLQEEQGEGRTALYLGGFLLLLYCWTPRHRGRLLLAIYKYRRVVSSSGGSSGLQLPARAALVHPPLQILRDTLSTRVALYHTKHMSYP